MLKYQLQTKQEEKAEVNNSLKALLSSHDDALEAQMQISDQLVEGVDAEQVANQKENQQRLETYEQPQEDVLKDIQQLDAVHFSLHHFLCLFFLFLEIFEGLVDPAVSEPRDSYQQQDNRNADQEGSVEFVDEVGGVDIVLLRGQYDSRDQCPQGSRSDDFIDYSLIGFTAELFGADELGEHLLFGEAHSYCPYKADFQDVCEHNNAIINT